MHELSRRLSLVADMIPLGDNVCDVGTDHGYLPIFLSKSGKYGRITATDIREKPLENAKENLLKSDIKNVRLLLCDGLSAVNRADADTVIIAGMGGDVISGIIGRTEFLKENVTLILQPMTAASDLRRYLCENGFNIIEETPIEENGKLYSVIKSRYIGKSFLCDDAFALVGKIDCKTELGKKYTDKQISVCNKAMEKLKSSAENREKYNEFLNTKNKLLKLTEE